MRPRWRVQGEIVTGVAGRFRLRAGPMSDSARRVVPRQDRWSSAGRRPAPCGALVSIRPLRGLLNQRGGALCGPLDCRVCAVRGARRSGGAPVRAVRPAGGARCGPHDWRGRGGARGCSTSAVGRCAVGSCAAAERRPVHGCLRGSRVGPRHHRWSSAGRRPVYRDQQPRGAWPGHAVARLLDRRGGTADRVPAAGRCIEIGCVRGVVSIRRCAATLPAGWGLGGLLYQRGGALCGLLGHRGGAIARTTQPAG